MNGLTVEGERIFIMKDEIMQRLAAVLGALNHTTVCGKENLANLSGSIAVLEEVCGMLERAEILERTPQAEAQQENK